MNAATLTAQQARKQLGDLPAELRAIDSLTMSELQVKFADVFGHRTASRNRTYLQRKIRFRIQELLVGGLTERAHARADVLAEGGRVQHGKAGPRVGVVRPPEVPVVAEAATLVPGTRLRREHQGQEHEVLVLTHGRFEYCGRAFTSLSTIAKQITGTTWNGKLFFGLKTRAKRAR
jgi:hypothetical protein